MFDIADAAPPATGDRGDAAALPGWIGALYVLVTLSLLVPLWSVARVPTVDGPCHLYNAWVLRHLHDPAYPLFATHFRLDPSPIPNWLIQALLYGLLAVAQPATAEKLLLTLYVLGFAGAAWWYAGCRGPRGAAYAFLALPFVYNVMVHFGFYNFALSVPLCLTAVALWWRGRDRPDASLALRLNLVLVLCYFAHIVSLAVALLAIGVLWLTGREGRSWRTWWRHPLLLLPQLPLPVLFASGQHGVVQHWTASELWAYLGTLGALFRFERDLPLGPALAVLFAALVAAALVMKRPAAAPSPHPFLLAALAVLALYFVAPNAIGEGGWISPRLSLYPFLLVLPALPHTVRLRERGALAIACTLLVLVEVGVVTRRHRGMAREVDAFLAGLAPVPRDSRVLAFVWQRAERFDRSVLGHAIGYVALGKGLIDWDDYQPFSDLFPIHAQPGLELPGNVEVEPDYFPIAARARLVDAVYTWGAPPGSRLRRELQRSYRRVAKTGEGELWIRSDLPARAPRVESSGE